ncbi:MAG: AAA family ATPase, partial [Anaerolineae bacterium]|nr:AAA family ATPase [Anaerolineae bacterium]
MFISDQPIADDGEDLLGVAAFAHTIGEAIVRYEAVSGLVFGLFGKWGSGKTSILNLTLRHIERLMSTVPQKLIVIRFDPWMFSGQDQLFLQFFEQLATQLSAQGDGFQEISRQMRRYGRLFAQSYVPSDPGSERQPRSVPHEAEVDISSLKQDLTLRLRSRAQKIVIVIDDVDRLSDDEIRQVLQIVKSAANFPYVVYLLAFDEEIVSAALSRTYNGRGTEYLEKVIQVGFRVPAVSEVKLYRILSSHLERLVDQFPRGRWDEGYWNSVYRSFFQLFTSVRDINRYLNTTQFYVGLLSEETNPIDFFLIMALHVFSPELYAYIRDNRRYFVDRAFDNPLIANERDRARFREVHAQALSHKTRLRKGQLREVLENLFPIVRDIAENVSVDTSRGQRTWGTQKRICSADHFDTYFRLTIPDERIADSALRALVASADDFNRLTTELQYLIRDGGR